MSNLDKKIAKQLAADRRNWTVCKILLLFCFILLAVFIAVYGL
tara:strand:+ start:2318 stop:2446 length:129 start_codon:yes stop_codon:yes gene_type:complete